MLGCYSLMLGFDEALDLDWDAAQLTGTDISWISVNSSKPGRPDDYSLLVHSNNDWAEEHLDDDVDAVKYEYLCSQVAYRSKCIFSCILICIGGVMPTSQNKIKKLFLLILNPNWLLVAIGVKKVE